MNRIGKALEANLSYYNNIKRSGAKNSVNAARVVDPLTGKSQKDQTCDKLNLLLNDHPQLAMDIINRLVAFKALRQQKQTSENVIKQESCLANIMIDLQIINDMSEDASHYPSLHELEVLVKNSSSFVQRAIPSHFKHFLCSLSPKFKQQITDIGNIKFLHDNGVLTPQDLLSSPTLHAALKKSPAKPLPFNFTKLAAQAVAAKKYDHAVCYLKYGLINCLNHKWAGYDDAPQIQKQLQNILMSIPQAQRLNFLEELVFTFTKSDHRPKLLNLSPADNIWPNDLFDSDDTGIKPTPNSKTPTYVENRINLAEIVAFFVYPTNFDTESNSIRDKRIAQHAALVSSLERQIAERLVAPRHKNKQLQIANSRNQYNNIAHKISATDNKFTVWNQKENVIAEIHYAAANNFTIQVYLLNEKVEINDEELLNNGYEKQVDLKEHTAINYTLNNNDLLAEQYSKINQYIKTMLNYTKEIITSNHSTEISDEYDNVAVDEEEASDLALVVNA